MVIAGTINRVAFYCRVNHRDRDYEKYLDDVMRRLEEEYGKRNGICRYSLRKLQEPTRTEKNLIV